MAAADDDASSLSCLVFTDLAGSTALKAEHGDTRARTLIDRHRAHVRALASTLGGREIDCAGDGFFLTFPSATSAVAFGLGLQQRHAADADLPAVRVGIHLGEVDIRRAPPGSSKPTLVEGLAVDVASRIASLARPGQVLLSRKVLDEARQRMRDNDLDLPVFWFEHGPFRLQGVAQPIEIGEASLRAEPPSPPPDSPKASRFPRRGRIPTPLTTFVGRERQLAELAELVVGHRLVTVIGTPGTGKTRTAVQVALQAPPPAGGVWFVELASERDAAGIVLAMARALSIAPEGGIAMLDAVVEALEVRPALLILDNCEHLVDAVADLAVRLLQRCSDLHVLTTSRQPLRCRGEYVYPLSPMPCEREPGAPSEAASLFIERALAEGLSATQMQHDLDAIELLCARLDGLPLAIELAATRARTIGPRELARLADQRLRVLRGPRHTATARNDTLRAAIDWSYEFLDDVLARLFERLSIFSGAFDATDALAVAGEPGQDEIDLLDLLSDLADRSLVVAASGASPTYRLLETLRAYGAERLAARAEHSTLLRRHAEHFTAKALAARNEVVGPDHVAIIDSLVAQVAEFRDATAWALAIGDHELALRVTVAFCGASYFRIGFDALDWLGDDPSADLRGGTTAAELLGLLARRALFYGRPEPARMFAERSVAIDPGAGSIQARAQLALLAGAVNDAAALQWAQSVIDVAQANDDRLGMLLGYLLKGPLLARIGRDDDALETGRALLALADRFDAPHARGWAHHVTGVALQRRDSQAAKRHLALAVQLGRSEKNPFLQSNAMTAELQIHLADDSPIAAAREAHRALTQLRDSDHIGYFVRRMLSELAVFLARLERTEAVVIDGYLRRFGGSDPYARDDQARSVELCDLERAIGEASVARLRRSGAQLNADAAVAAAVAALCEIAEA